MKLSDNSINVQFYLDYDVKVLYSIILYVLLDIGLFHLLTREGLTHKRKEFDFNQHSLHYDF